ncbi:MAG: hypothetical protein HRK26_00225 [Rickettsiaceae bacterium H1]|nr:hypothetical protein [Rickettsiaceae bacterium H1]
MQNNKNRDQINLDVLPVPTTQQRSGNGGELRANPISDLAEDSITVEEYELELPYDYKKVQDIILKIKDGKQDKLGNICPRSYNVELISHGDEKTDAVEKILDLLSQKNIRVKSLGLTRLGFEEITLGGGTARKLKNFSSLKSLDLHHVNITGNFLQEIFVLSSLKNLSLNGCEGFDDADLKNIGNLTELESLNLSFTNIEGDCLQNIPASLKRLGLYCCRKFSYVNLNKIKDYVNLERLGLSWTNGKNERLPRIPNLSSLKELMLDFYRMKTENTDCKVNEINLPCFPLETAINFPNLVNLVINGPQGLRLKYDEQELERLREKKPTSQLSDVSIIGNNSRQRL